MANVNQIKNNLIRMNYYFQEGHCYINDICLEKNEKQMGDVCNICNPEASQTSWTRGKISSTNIKLYD